MLLTYYYLSIAPNIILELNWFQMAAPESRPTEDFIVWTHSDEPFLNKLLALNQTAFVSNLVSDDGEDDPQKT